MSDVARMGRKDVWNERKKEGRLERKGKKGGAINGWKEGKEGWKEEGMEPPNYGVTWRLGV